MNHKLRLISKEYTMLDKSPNQANSIYNQPYPLKSSYTSILPRKIFQTWGTKDLPPKMKENLATLKQQNPEFEFFLFDDNDCREFIKTHFEPDVLEAYDTLIPGAFKADLWRLCVLYIHGGIYMDIKLRCINNFKLIELTEEEHFVRDRIGPLSIYNALMACTSKNPFLLLAIKKIVSNVKTRYYGTYPLLPTGPSMLGYLVLEHTYELNIDIFHKKAGDHLVYKKHFILETQYPGYREEQNEFYKSQTLRNYGDLWTQQKIYKPLPSQSIESNHK